MEDFLVRRGWIFLVLIAALSVLSFFFLKPERLVPEKCAVEGFECSELRLSQSGGSLSFALHNRVGKGIMVKSIHAYSVGNASCRAVFDDGWGPFAVGRHLDANEFVPVSAGCSGVPFDTVGSGNKRFFFEVEWFPDNLSEAYSSVSKGSLFVGVDP